MKTTDPNTDVHTKVLLNMKSQMQIRKEIDNICKAVEHTTKPAVVIPSRKTSPGNIIINIIIVLFFILGLLYLAYGNHSRDGDFSHDEEGYNLDPR